MGVAGGKKFRDGKCVVGMGYPEATIESIQLQAFDIPMTSIETGSRAGSSRAAD